MMHGGPGLTFADPARIDALKADLAITPAQEPAWTKYAKAVQDAAATMRTARESIDPDAMSKMTPSDRFAFVTKMREQGQQQFGSVKTAAEELLATLDATQKAKASDILPGLAFGPGRMRGAMPAISRTSADAIGVSGRHLHAATHEPSGRSKRPEGDHRQHAILIKPPAEVSPCRSKHQLTRRQALLLSGSAAAGLAAAGLPRWAHSAPSSALALPIPKLIEARNSEPVTLVVAKERSIGSARAPRCRRGESRRATLDRSCASAAAKPFPSGLKTTSTRRRPCIGTGCWCPRTWMAVRTTRLSQAVSGLRRLRSSNRRRRHWFHPHPHGDTARQVYLGLAGMMIVERWRRPRPRAACNLRRRRSADWCCRTSASDATASSCTSRP